MKTPTSTPRELSSAVVRSLHQNQEDRANDNPHGPAHNGNPGINTHGGYHSLSGNVSAHIYGGGVGVYRGIHNDNDRN